MSEIHLESRGSFQAEKHAASGAHAEVWLARGPEGRFALKVARNTEHAERLRHAVQIAERVGGPRTLRAVLAAEDAIAVEWFDGMPILDWCKNRSWEDIRAALSGLAELLEAHESAGVYVDELASRHLLVDAAARVRIIDLGAAFFSSGDAEPSTFHRTRFGLLLSDLLDRCPPAAGALHDLALALTTSPNPPAWPEILATLRTARRSPVRPYRAPFPRAMQLLTELLDEVKLGECRVVVVYGTRGSGRSTLLSEALRHARLAGFKLRKGVDDNSPTIWLGHAAQPADIRQVAAAIASGNAGLYLIESDLPLPSLGEKAIQYALPPLTAEAVISWWNAEGLDAEAARRAWECCQGHPATLRWRLASELQQDAPAAGTLTTDLLRLFQRYPSVSVADAALRLGVPPLDVIDAAEPMVVTGRITFSSDGRTMSAMLRSTP